MISILDLGTSKISAALASNENNKLKLLNGNDEFNFVISGLKNKTITSIKFINITGVYQNVELNNNDWLFLEDENTKENRN